MAKKIEILIILALLITIPVGLNFFSKYSTPKEPTATQTPIESGQTQQPQTQESINAQTSLTFSPNIYTLASSSGSIDILIDTGVNNATAVQLEISYDPQMLTNVAITSGSFFPQPIELLKKIDQTTGKISYAFGAALTDKGKAGKGTIATITFTASGLQKGQSTTLTFLPKTIVTAEGISSSVLKSTSGATIQK